MGKPLLLLMSFEKHENEMAVFRWEKFAKYLNKSGWEINWLPVRVLVMVNLFQKIKLLFREVKKIQHVGRFDGPVIVATFPFAEPLAVGVILKLLNPRKRLVLEFRDIYARNRLYNFGLLKRKIEMLKEFIFLLLADRLIFLTQGIKDHYALVYPNFKKITTAEVVTNGYDRDDYKIPVTKVNHQKLLINYTGSFYGSRNPQILLMALKELIEDESSIKDNFRIEFYGRSPDYPIRDRINKFGMEKHLFYFEELIHSESMKKINDADVNLIITHTQGSEYALPGKLFEYMGSGNPVWVITNDQLLKELVLKYALGYISDFDKESIKGTIKLIFNEFKQSNLKLRSLPEEFDVSNLTNMLLKVLVD